MTGTTSVARVRPLAVAVAGFWEGWVVPVSNEWTVPGYTHVRELGSGASGRVTLAVRNTTGERVAIKYLSPRLRADGQFVARFRSEARTLAALTDPHLVRLHDYVEAFGGAAIVMELVDGVSLRAILSSRGRLEPEAALVVLKGSLQGLGAAHAASIVHRDYKPENVLVPAEGESRLVDFGVAVPAGADARFAGTPPYAAPEQWAGAAVGPATDVYAATVVFFECLAGGVPYTATTLQEWASAHANAPVPVAAVPEPLRPLVARGMAKSPGERPRSAQAFAEQLETAARGAYGPDWESRGRRALAAAAAAFAALFPLALADSTLAPGTAAPANGGELLVPMKGSLLRRFSGKLFRSRVGVAITSGATAAILVLGGGAIVLDHRGDTTSQPPGTTQTTGPSTTGAAATPTPTHSLPTEPPKGPDDIIVIIEKRVRGNAASYSYDNDSCCNNAFDAFGTVTSDEPVSEVDIPRLVNPYRVLLQEPWWQHVRCHVSGNRVRVNAGEGWRTFSASEVTAASASESNAAQAGWQALRTRQAVGTEHLLALLESVEGKLQVTTKGGTFTYTGSAAIPVLTKDARVSALYGGIDPGIKTKTDITFTIQMNESYLPVHLDVRADYGAGRIESFRVDYWNWHRAAVGTPSP